MKGKSNLALAAFYFSLLFIVSCEENSPEPISEPDEADNRQVFSLEMFDDATRENLSFQYDDFVEVGMRNESSATHRSLDRSKEKWFEYKSRFKGHKLIEDNNSSRNIFFTLLKRVRENEPPVFLLLKFVPSIKLDNSKEYAYFNLQDFSGTIYTYSDQAEEGHVVGVSEGRIQDIVRAEEKKGSNNPGGRVMDVIPPPDDCDIYGCGGGGGGGGGSWQWEIYRDYTDWFQVTSGGGVNYVQFLGSDYLLKTRNVWVPDNSPPNSGEPHEHTSAGNGGYSTSSPHPNGYLKDIRLDLEDMINQDPFALVEECDQIGDWQILAQNGASTAIKNKINQLQSQNNSWFDNWAVQTLNGANGTIANMDYFSVDVSTLPIDPATGQRFSATGFLDHFRRNINNFVTGSTFGPYCETPTICSQETAIWNSNNPTGAIVYIDIPGDDGAVVCSEYASDYWLFMTLEAPGAGNHPVSGTRQFGFEPNGSGGYRFFVRGVDRFDSNIMENASFMVFGGQPFAPADDLWESFQSKLDQFINNNGGSSQVIEPVTFRQDWEKIREVLLGERPISDIGCN